MCGVSQQEASLSVVISIVVEGFPNMRIANRILIGFAISLTATLCSGPFIRHMI